MAFNARLSSAFSNWWGSAKAGPDARAENGLDADIGAERAPQHVEHARDQPVGIDTGRLERLATGEGEQPLGELRRALRALHGGVHRLSQFGAQLGSGAVLGEIEQIAPDRVEIAENDGEQIVEVVRDAAGELAHGFHLLRLEQRRLRLLAKFRLGLQLLGARDQSSQGLQRRKCEKAGKQRGRDQGEADEEGEQIALFFGLGLALGKELALGLDHSGDVFADVIDQLPAARRIEDGKRLLGLPLLDQCMRALELVQLGVDELAKLGHPRSLLWVVAGERAEPVELFGNRLHGAAEGFHVVGRSRQQEAALVGLGVPDVDQQALGRLLHLQSMHDHLVGIAGADQPDHHGDGRDEQQKEARRDDDLGVLQQSVGFQGARRHGSLNLIWTIGKTTASGAFDPSIHLLHAHPRASRL